MSAIEWTRVNDVGPKFRTYRASFRGLTIECDRGAHESPPWRWHITVRGDEIESSRVCKPGLDLAAAKVIAERMAVAMMEWLDG